MERLPHFRPAQIAFVAGLALCLVDGAIAGPPKATTSQYFKTYADGFSWVRTGEGSATLELDVLPDAQKALFVEVAFPNPDNPHFQAMARSHRTKGPGLLQTPGAQDAELVGTLLSGGFRSRYQNASTADAVDAAASGG